MLGWRSLEMGEPKVMVQDDEAAGKDKQWIGQFHNWEAAQVLHVRDMAPYGKEGQFGREAIHKAEESLYEDDEVYEVCEDPLGDDRMLLHKFREVI